MSTKKLFSYSETEVDFFDISYITIAKGRPGKSRDTRLRSASTSGMTSQQIVTVLVGIINIISVLAMRSLDARANNVM